MSLNSGKFSKLLGLALVAVVLVVSISFFFRTSSESSRFKDADVTSDVSVSDTPSFEKEASHPAAKVGDNTPRYPLGKELLKQRSSIGKEMSEEDRLWLRENGILCNSDRDLTLLKRDPRVLNLKNAIIDTTIPDTADLLIPEKYRAAATTKRFIVQFTSAISVSQTEAIEAAGATVEHFLPNRAYAITANPEAMKKIGTMEDVAFVQAYHPFYKMSMDVKSYLTGLGPEDVAEYATRGRYYVLMFKGSEAVAEMERLGAEVEAGKIGEDIEVAKVSCAPELLESIVKIDGVSWVEGEKERKAMNDRAVVYTRAKPIKTTIPGIDGSGVIIGVCDTGIDFKHMGFSEDPSLGDTGTNFNTRIVYYGVETGGSSDGIPGDAEGHGTHVAGSILGNGAWSDTASKVPGSGTAPYDPYQFAGIAPKAKLVMLEDFNSFDDTNITKIAYDHGARIANNSWGANWPYYDAMSMIWDQLVRDANSEEDGNQEYIVFFAAGNEGGGNNEGTGGLPYTVGMPANAKNVITVGAVEQRRLANNLPYPYDSYESTDSDFEVASYSSRGPTPDGRHKPDICAPGSYVMSVQTKDANFDEVSSPTGVDRDWHNGNVDTGPHYAVMSGTSMATPITAGCGALIYQYFTNYYGKAPSPALMKALMVNGAQWLNTVDYELSPNYQPIVYEGWGEIDVTKAIKGPGARATDQISFYDQTDIVMAGDYKEYTVKITEDDPGGLKITLAWTDRPGSPGSGAALVNDLDLEVRKEGDGEAVYLGNYMWRYPWGSASIDASQYDAEMLEAVSDRANNVEQVIVRHARKGTYKIRVRGHNVYSSSSVLGQDFALVIAKGVSSLGDSGGTHPQLALDPKGYPVLITRNLHESSIAEPQVAGVRRWVGSFGDGSEFGTWRMLRDKWFDYGTEIDAELISGYVYTSYIEDPDIAVAPNGYVYAAWTHHPYTEGEPSCIYLRYWNGTNWLALGNSYDRYPGICDSPMEDNAHSPNIGVGSDGWPIVSYIQERIDFDEMSYSQEVVVKKWNNSTKSWVNFGNTTRGVVSVGAFADSLDMVMNGGNPVVAWYDLSTFRIMVYRWTGSGWSKVGANIGTMPDMSVRPRLAVSGGNIYLAWSELPESIDKFGQTIRVAVSSGGAWSGLGGSMVYPGVSIPDGDGVNPQIAVAGGNVYVAWQEGEGVNNSILVKRWNGSSWRGINGSDVESIVPLGGLSVLKSMVVHPAGLPVVAFENTRGGFTSSGVAGLAADIDPPMFSGIVTADGTISNSVITTWVPLFAGGLDVTYEVYRSPTSWDPADTAIPPADNPATIAAVFNLSSRIAYATNKALCEVRNVSPSDRVWYWGVRAVNSSGIRDSNTRLILTGPYSLTGDVDGDWLTAAEELDIGTSPTKKDTDDDGMWDGWEFFYSYMNTGQVVGLPAHTNALSMDPLDDGTYKPGTGPYDDLDGDGLLNIEEFEYWRDNFWRVLSIADRTNPFNWLLDPTNPDSDGDGMPDGWEVLHGLNPSDPGDANDDPDGDGVPNWQEYLIGGNPWMVDSDFDGLTDSEERDLGTRADLPDSDEDGLLDGYELLPYVDGDPTLADSNNNGVPDGDEFELGWSGLKTPRDLGNTLVKDDFESGAPGWTMSSIGVQLWHLTTADPDPPGLYGISRPYDHTPSYSFRCANDPTASDTNATYEMLGELISCSLVSPPFNPATNGCVSVVLSWNEWYQTETMQDLCTVQISRDGVQWLVVRPGVSGVSTGWVHRVVSLDDYASDTNVRVRFQFRTLNKINNHYQGWYVDDVRIFGATKITGNVRDINGRPLRGAMVYAMGRNVGIPSKIGLHNVILPGKIFGMAKADSDGNYEISGLWKGWYTVKAQHPGYKAEFWNGDLYPPGQDYADSFGQEINPGVFHRYDVTTYCNLSTNNATGVCHFELEPGQARCSFGVFSSHISGQRVFLNQSITNESVWNGLTNIHDANLVPYTLYYSRNLNSPNWDTNPETPNYMGDVMEGEHIIYLHPDWPNMPLLNEIKVPVRDGEITLVNVVTQYLSGSVFIVSDTADYEIWVDGRDTGKVTVQGEVSLGLMASGQHELLLKSSSRRWLPPKSFTVQAQKYIRVEYNVAPISNDEGWVTIHTKDMHGNPVEGFSVYVDSMPIGTNDVIDGKMLTPLTLRDLKQGKHWLALLKDGYKTTPRMAMTVYAGTTNTLNIVVYDSDKDYDGVGDSFEISAYTNRFLYASSDDMDNDGLTNLEEFDLFRVYGLKLDLGNPDSDGDGVTDGDELAFDGLPKQMSLSVLYTNTPKGSESVKVYFRGRFLEGVSDMQIAPNNYLSIDGDMFLTTSLVWSADSYGTPLYDFGVSSFGTSNTVVSWSHIAGARVFGDMIPDEVDTDGDGMWDGFEFQYLGVGDLNPIEYGNQDGDPDFDGLSNIREFLGYDRIANTNDWTNPGNADTDGDGMPDGWEMDHGLNPTDPNDAFLDPDNDGLTNYEEWLWGTDPHNPDSDEDGIVDGLEVHLYKTDPNNPDTDGDGLLDGQEVIDTDLDPSNGVDGGFFPNWNGGDMDNDGYMDGPTDWDTDGDGMPDGFEVLDLYGRIRPEGQRLDPSDPTDAHLDYDGDGLSNLEEYLVRDALFGVPPGNFGLGGVIWDYSTDPFNPDTDGDGMPDGFEVLYGLHPVDPVLNFGFGTNQPVEFVRHLSLYKFGDLDGDGVANINEYSVRFIINPNADPHALEGSTHPWLPDTDGDGLWDGEEIKSFRSNPLSVDTDNDGLPDGSADVTRVAEVNTSGPGSHYDMALNDLWRLEDVGLDLPYPVWTLIVPNNPSRDPSPRWGSAMASSRYFVRDAYIQNNMGGFYVSMNPNHYEIVPHNQLLLANDAVAIFGGRDGITHYNESWEYDIDSDSWSYTGIIHVPGLDLVSGTAELMSATRFYVTDTYNPRNIERRPRPGSLSDYQFYGDLRMPVPLWREGVETINYDRTILLGGWVMSGGYYFNPAGAIHDEQIQVREFDTFSVTNIALGAVYPRRYYKTTDVRAPIEYGWKYTSSAYRYTDQPLWGEHTVRYSYDDGFDEEQGLGFLRIGNPTGTNVIWTGFTFSRVKNSRHDYSNPLDVTATIRLSYQSSMDVTVMLFAALDSVEGTPNNSLFEGMTLTSPTDYYRAPVEGRPAESSPRNNPQARRNNYAFTTAPRAIVFPNTGGNRVSFDIDVTSEFISMLGTSTAPLVGGREHQGWKIGNNMGFVLQGVDGVVGDGWIKDNEDTRDIQLIVTINNPPYREEGATYYNLIETSVWPYERKSGAMAYSERFERFVCFGGVDSVRALNDTWVSTTAGYEWDLLFTENAPPARWGHTMVPIEEGVMIFGGFDSLNRPLNDAWWLDEDEVWHEFALMDSQIPPPRGGHAMGMAQGLICMFGGTDNKQYFNDLWVFYPPGSTNIYDGAKWLNIQPHGQFSGGIFGSPSPRAFMGFATCDLVMENPWNRFEVPYDVVVSRMDVFGGRCGLLPTASDTDQDMLSDGLEIELGGVAAGRDPRHNALFQYVSTNMIPEKMPFDFTPIGYPAMVLWPASIVDFESLESWDDAANYAAGIFLPVEGFVTNNFYFPPPPGPLAVGYNAYAPELVAQWWHCYRSTGPVADPRDVWEFGVPNAIGLPSNAVPKTAHSGRNCFGTKLNGTYPNDAYMELYTPLLDLSETGNSTNSYFLVFYEWLDLADRQDMVRIEAIRPESLSEIVRRVPSPSNLQSVITILPNRNMEHNTSGEWRRTVVPLDQIANEYNIYLRFILQSDAATNAGGWYIDDVAILQGGLITGTYPAGSNVYLYGQYGTNYLQKATAGYNNDFGFEMLPAGNYRVISGDGSIISGAIVTGGGTWNVGISGLGFNEIVMGIVVNSPAKISWTADPGLTYEVQYTTPQAILGANPWTPLDRVKATGPIAEYIDIGSDTEASRFYRVVLIGIEP